ncbi:hypothetical protein H7Y29_01860 [Microbacteriaceae bacterium]|nr:hypothetical protein [Candidatus Saccharibacteria bacterium]
MKSVFNRLSMGLATAVIVLAQVVMPVQAAFADDNGNGDGNDNSSGNNDNGNKVVTNPQIVTPTTQSISAKALTDHTCNTTEWHFVITQVDTAANAPATISVTFGNGSTATVQLNEVTGGTAHYLTTQNLNSTVNSATATIYAGWTGQFNLSHGPCAPVEQAKTQVTAVNGVFADDCGLEFNLAFTAAVTEGVTYTQTRSENKLTVTATVTDSTKYTLTNPNWMQSQTDLLVACNRPTIKPCTTTPTTTVSKYEDFADYNDTRATGHTKFLSNGLRIWTDGATSTDKVAWYNAVTPYSLADIGVPSIDYTNTAGGVPGMQISLDKNGDGISDGILVGEPATYGNNWWSNGSFGISSGMGYTSYGTLQDYLTANPDAKVLAVGFSLGSGVKGDGVLHSLTFGCQKWVFEKAAEVPHVCPANTEWSDMNKNSKVDEGECYKKVFVCKFVGIPGINERLQTGQNPISVSVNSIKDFNGLGSYFNDKQERSLVIAFDEGQAKPSVDTCTPGKGSVPEVPVVPTTPVVPVVPGKGSVTPTTVTELPETGAGTNALLIGLIAAAAAYGAVYFAQSKRQYE